MSAISSSRAAAIDRRDDILNAAKRCFVRGGMSRTTMSDLAAAARIETSLLYREFPTKEAVILALVERERERCIGLAHVFEQQGDRREALFAALAEYVVAIPPDAARLLVEIWTDGARDHRIAPVIQRMEVDIAAWFVRTLTALEPSPDCDPCALYTALYRRVWGILIARARIPGFAVAPAIATVCALLDAGLHGSHEPHRSRPDRRHRATDDGGPLEIVRRAAVKCDDGWPMPDLAALRERWIATTRSA